MKRYIPQEFSTKLIGGSSFVIMGNTMPPRDPEEDEEDEEDDEEDDNIILRHDHAASFRLHRTVPAVEGGPATIRAIVGSRNYSRRLPADGAPGWRAGPLFHAKRA